MRQLAEQPAAARAEIAELTDVARTALHAVREVAHHRPAISLPAELASARALLTAAGVTADLHGSAEALSGDIEEILAWTVREGTTNVLRHSNATTTTMGIIVADDRAILTLCNDGARAQADPGSGLTGLADRAAAVGGWADFRCADGHFTLRVELPREAE